MHFMLIFENALCSLESNETGDKQQRKSTTKENMVRKLNDAEFVTMKGVLWPISQTNSGQVFRIDMEGKILEKKT